MLFHTYWILEYVFPCRNGHKYRFPPTPGANLPKWDERWVRKKVRCNKMKSEICLQELELFMRRAHWNANQEKDIYWLSENRWHCKRWRQRKCKFIICWNLNPQMKRVNSLDCCRHPLTIALLIWHLQRAEDSISQHRSSLVQENWSHLTPFPLQESFEDDPWFSYTPRFPAPQSSWKFADGQQTESTCEQWLFSNNW